MTRKICIGVLASLGAVGLLLGVVNGNKYRKWVEHVNKNDFECDF